MIKVKLLLADYMISSGDAVDLGRQRAINSITALLSQIDFKAEAIPENNQDMLTRLLRTLKGGQLDKEESKLIEEIVNY